MKNYAIDRATNPKETKKSQILKLFKKRYRVTEIAKKVNCSRAYVYEVLTKKGLSRENVI